MKLSGLTRVRHFIQDDAHIYCRPDQVQDEITGVLALVREFYKLFNLEPSYKLGTRPAVTHGSDFSATSATWACRLISTRWRGRREVSFWSRSATMIGCCPSL